MTKTKSKKLVAVYGTLRKGESNSELLSKSEYLGRFQTKPIFSMYDVNEAYPALVLNGKTSIVMEVYKVDDDTLKDINILEGYSNDPDTDLYDRKVLMTPYGEAYFYVYDNPVDNYTLIKEGDWVEYISLLPINKLTAH